MSHVFISYKSDDVEAARWVKERLEEKGIPCWFAPTSIPGGGDYAEEIPKAIRRSFAFILILSKTTHESPYVPKEIDLAIISEKPILPFMIDDFELTDKFSFYLSNVNYFPAYESREKCIELIASRIDDILNGTTGGKTIEEIREDIRRAKLQQKFEQRLDNGEITPPPAEQSGRSYILTLLLSIFLGYFGIHRFYNGRIITGIIWFFSGGLGGLGWIADIIIILIGKFKDSDGKPVKRKKK